MTSAELKHQAKLQTWSAAIQACRSSGSSITQWCKQREVTRTTYCRWNLELLALVKTEKNTLRETVVFVELPSLFESGKNIPVPPNGHFRPALTAPKHEMQNVSERVATIRINDVRIDIYTGMQPELLKTLVKREDCTDTPSSYKQGFIDIK